MKSTKKANAISNISNTLKILPDSSGSYQFFNATDEIIYIGKAKNLKKRVSSYFNKVHTSPKLNVMMPQVAKIEFIITDSEIEALILESHLIKKHQPKYNVLLKDDKKFPYFVITNEDYPRILVVRKQNKNAVKGKYFGPYTNSRAMYSTLDLIKKLFPLKQCKQPKFKDRPCIYYQIGRCLAPCQEMISSADYKKIIKNVELFLSGKQRELVNALKIEMEKYAKNQEFEKAARFRDSFLDVQKTIEQQKVVSENTSLSQDIIAFELNDGGKDGLCAVVLLQIRQGRLIGKKDFELDFSTFENSTEISATFLREYYELLSNEEFPSEILLSEPLSNDDKKLYAEWLGAKSKQVSKVVKPFKIYSLGPKMSKKNVELVELAKKNAKMHLEKIKIDRMVDIQSDYNDIGNYIMEKLHLKKFPHSVACFDISHIQGTNTVASMVFFENGIPKKSSYKRFKLRTTELKPDDFKSMQEVIKRQYSKNILPDLIIIDGGKGQLSAVMQAFEDLNASKTLQGFEQLDIVALAKKREEIFSTEGQKSVIFPANSGALYFFQRVRDEAHRFAITYHRKLRSAALKQP